MLMGDQLNILNTTGHTSIVDVLCTIRFSPFIKVYRKTTFFFFFCLFMKKPSPLIVKGVRMKFDSGQKRSELGGHMKLDRCN